VISILHDSTIICLNSANAETLSEQELRLCGMGLKVSISLSLIYKLTCQGRQVWKLKLNDLRQTVVISASFNCGGLDFLHPMLQCSRAKLYWLVGCLTNLCFTKKRHFVFMTSFERIKLILQSRINNRRSTKLGIIYGKFKDQRHSNITYISLWKIMKPNLSWMDNSDLHAKRKILWHDGIF
jgi:hypothetical protein